MKNNLFFFIALFSFNFYSLFAQKAVMLNGGQFGNPNQNANVVIYDIPTNTHTTIDTIHTNSVQDLLVDGNKLYVLAQDSIVLYDAINQNRTAAKAFQGVSTKTLALSGNELLVGNWFGKTADNLYIYDAFNLQLLDSVSAVEQGVTSMLLDSGYAYLTQNQSTANFEDTLGMIIKVDIAARQVVDTIQLNNYTGGFGELIHKPDGSGFYSFNSTSNTITSVDFSSLSASNTSLTQELETTNRSQWSIHADTLFLKMNGGIGAMNLQNLNLIDSLIVDTVVTAFAYDTLNRQFLVTQTDFFSFTSGKIYNRNGIQTDTLITGFSPEVIDILPVQPVGIDEFGAVPNAIALNIYPNPSRGIIHFQLEGQLESEIQVQLFDQKGSLIFNQISLSGQGQLDLSSYPKGIYFLNAWLGQDRISKKIILQ